jgi:hypothetical protein
MVVDFNQTMDRVAKELIKHTGHANYWLHNEIGGNGWKVERATDTIKFGGEIAYHSVTRVTLDDDKSHLATFIQLSMK